MSQSIKTYLEDKKIYPSKNYKHKNYGMYYSPIRQNEKNPSFKVDYTKNVFMDFGLGVGGGIFKLKELMDDLNISSKYLKKVNSNNSKKVKESKPFKAWKTSEITNKRIIDYIAHRKIDINIANKYCLQIDYGYYQNYPKTELGIINNKGGFDINASNGWKGCVGIKTFSFINNNSNTINVFEGLFDFLTFIQLYPDSLENHLILNSANQAKNTVSILRKHLYIHLFLDNDEQGNKATQLLLNQLKEKSITDHRKSYADFGDLNEMLIKQGGF